MADASTFSAPQICAFAGVTFRQLDYWCRTDLLRPLTPARGSGTRRAFSARDLQVAWVLGRVSALGLAGPLPRVGALLHELGEMRGWLVLTADGVEHVDVLDLDVVALWPAFTVVDLSAAPLAGAALPREEACA